MVIISSSEIFGQAKKPNPVKKPVSKDRAVSSLPKVTQIDAEALKNLLKPHGKPLLINFWATWCDPCREEFPDLVKIAADYQGKIDLITISLDDLAEINNDVPKFLAQMRSDSPAYLLKTPDEGAAIALVAKDWQGGLPFTILFNEKGEAAYSKQGKFKPELLRAEIDKSLIVPVATETTNIQTSALFREILVLPNSHSPHEKGKSDALRDILSEKLQIIRYGERSIWQTELKKQLKSNYGVEMLELGCKMSAELVEYVRGYNEVSEKELRNRFGEEIAKRLAQN